MPLLACTILLGAFLLFQVQPMVGKFLLPWFGGSPGVWNTCMLFFQTLLLGGYAYAHLLVTRFSPRRQAIIHSVLLVVACLCLPVIPCESWKPVGDESPLLRILLLLGVTVGLPYFALSATGPLIQTWVHRRYPERPAYRLFALSNAGSLLALVTYPFAIEPHLSRAAQAWVWSGGLVGFTLGMAWCAWKAAVPEQAEPVTRQGEGQPVVEAAPIPVWRRIAWVLLPATASLLLLAATNKMCLDIAVVPFLWVLPLALYLLTFIIAFDHPRWYGRRGFGLLVLTAFVFGLLALQYGEEWSIGIQIGVHSGVLFILCLACHGELYRQRPDGRRLSSFYLHVSAGGALGGFLVAVLAPRVFSDYHEYPLGLGLALLILFGVWWLDTALPALETLGLRRALRWLDPSWVLGRLRPPWDALVVAAVLATAFFGMGRVLREKDEDSDAVLLRVRNFYGTLLVKEHFDPEVDMDYRELFHGGIIHGLQLRDPAWRMDPTTYYVRGSGVGLAFENLPEKGVRHVGVVGLGTGTLAAYGRAGDRFRFYEINPAVIRIAREEFTYLEDCPAHLEMVLGDARLSMEREADQGFDLLALDAFSSDAIPVHLLTREAIDLYLRHLKPRGILAVHISNRHLDLWPVVARAAETHGLDLLQVDFESEDDYWYEYESSWVLLSEDPEVLRSEALQEAGWNPAGPPEAFREWTDDFSALFRILIPNSPED